LLVFSYSYFKKLKNFKTSYYKKGIFTKRNIYDR
jgi:hypothetical protein